MTKKEFLDKLEHKLHLLKRDEIQDILGISQPTFSRKYNKYKDMNLI